MFNAYALTRFAFKFQTVAVMRLSEAGKVTFTVNRLVRLRSGRRVYLPVRGSFIRTFSAANVTKRIPFTGCIGGRKLTPGYHQLVATSVDKLGNKRVAKRGFRILP